MAVREIRITPESLSARLSLKVKAGGATLRFPCQVCGFEPQRGDERDGDAHHEQVD